MQRRTISLTLVLLATLVLDGALLQRQRRYVDETTRLRGDMTAIERQRTDAILTAEAEESGVMLELMRRQASVDNALHLSINTDSSTAVFERSGAELRRFTVQVGPARRVGIPPDTLQLSVPQGTRTIERLLSATDAFALPSWLWVDRGLPVPADRSGAGWTGPDAVVMSGGTLVYALPSAGPRADSTYVMPGALRASAADLAAIKANLTRGMKVYFF